MSTVFIGQFVISKECKLRLNHFIKLSAYLNQNVFNIKILIDNKKNLLLHAYWEYNQKQIYVGSTGISDLILPWFEPDLSQYPKLVKRIKLLILLS